MGRVPDDQTDAKGTFMNDLIARYLACWNETDPAARRKLIEDTWAEDATYTSTRSPMPADVTP
jgi:hypothetical protein